MGPSRETKMPASGSKDALKQMLARPGSGEPDGEPMPLAQIHQELGKHVEKQQGGTYGLTAEPDGGPIGDKP